MLWQTRTGGIPLARVIRSTASSTIGTYSSIEPNTGSRLTAANGWPAARRRFIQGVHKPRLHTKPWMKTTPRRCAAAPSVKGLRQAEFAEGAAIVMFADWNDMTLARLFRSLKNFLIGQHGQEVADRALPEWDVQSATESAAAGDAPNSSQYQEHDTMDPAHSYGMR